MKLFSGTANLVLISVLKAVLPLILILICFFFFFLLQFPCPYFHKGCTKLNYKCCVFFSFRTVLQLPLGLIKFARNRMISAVARLYMEERNFYSVMLKPCQQLIILLCSVLAVNPSVEQAGSLMWCSSLPFSFFSQGLSNSICFVFILASFQAVEYYSNEILIIIHVPYPLFFNSQKMYILRLY